MKQNAVCGVNGIMERLCVVIEKFWTVANQCD